MKPLKKACINMVDAITRRRVLESVIEEGVSIDETKATQVSPQPY